MTDRETFEQWAAKQWGSDAWRHTSATSGEWEAFQAGCDMGRQAEPVAPRTLTDAEIDAVPFWGFSAADHGLSESEALREFARAVLAAAGAKP